MKLGGVTTYSVYNGWDLIGEYAAGATTPTVAYVSGAGGLVKNLTTNRYYYQDASGSTSHLADSTGHLLEWYRYDLQGSPVFYNSSNQQIIPPISNYGIRHLFTGQQWYAELGLYDLRNRYYSPDIGRFLQPDPIGFWGDRSNLYRYCGNNPVKRRDPFGLDDDKPLKLPDKGHAPDYTGGSPGGNDGDVSRVIVTGSDPNGRPSSAGPPAIVSFTGGGPGGPGGRTFFQGRENRHGDFDDTLPQDDILNNRQTEIVRAPPLGGVTIRQGPFRSDIYQLQLALAASQCLAVLTTFIGLLSSGRTIVPRIRRTSKVVSGSQTRRTWLSARTPLVVWVDLQALRL